MKVEAQEVELEMSLHANHRELWIRVLSDDPLGPQDFDKVKPHLEPDAMKDYLLGPCAFHVDEDDFYDDDPDAEDPKQGYAFEQWWVFPKMQARSN